jgi:hypothetical protein
MNPDSAQFHNMASNLGSDHKIWDLVQRISFEYCSVSAMPSLMNILRVSPFNAQQFKRKNTLFLTPKYTLYLIVSPYR